MSDKFSWHGERALLVILFILVFSLGILLRLNHLNILMRSPDERVYTHQAGRIAEDGFKATRQLVNNYNKDSRLWVYPPPTRIGYDYPLAALMKISGIRDETVGTYLSAAASIGTLFVLLLIGLRFFNPWVTLIALLGMSVSPMDLAIARRCWQDSLLAFVGILYIYICAELIKNPKKKILYLPLIAAGSYCLIIKESGVIIFGLGILWLLAEAVFRERSFSQAAVTLIVGILSAAISLLLLAKATGGLSNLLEVLRHMKEAMPMNAYAVKYQTGPWYRLIEGFWILTPSFTIAAFLGSITVFLNSRLKDSSVVRGIIFFTAAFVIITIITPYCQNMRYISVTFAPFYLLGGLGMWLAIRFLRNKMPTFSSAAAFIIISSLVVVIAIHDYKVYDRIFLKAGVGDLSIRLLREYS